YQDGKAVFKHAVIGMVDVSAEILKKNNYKAKDIKLFIPHQANYRIINAVAKKMEFSPDQTIINLNKYGNTTSATIPLAMSEAYQKKMMKKGDPVILTAFGAGFAWGSLLLRWAID
ncbi:unnamed protein product, partial [marine sediment metagenome]